MKRYILLQLFFLYVMMCYLPPIPLSYWRYFVTGIFLVILPLQFWLLPIGFILARDILEFTAILIMNPKAGYDAVREIGKFAISYSISISNLSDLGAMKVESEFWILFEKSATKYAWLFYYGPLVFIEVISPLISIAVFYLIARLLVKSARGIRQMLK